MPSFKRSPIDETDLSRAFALHTLAPALEPVVEFRFNDEGRTLTRNSGTESIQGEIKGKEGGPEALFSTDGEGVSGKPGDEAFNNTDAEGMGETPGGVVTIEHGGTLIDGAKSFTVAGWYKTAEGKPIKNNAVLLNIGSDDKTCGAILRAHNPNTAALQARVNGEAVAISPLDAYPEVNRWVFFAFTCDLTDPEKIGAYLYHGNDEREAHVVAKGKTRLTSVTGSDKPVSIGAIAGGLKPFKGWMDNVRIYVSKEDGSAALSAESVERLRRADLENP